MLNIRCIWKIEICSEELVDGHKTVPFQPDLSLFSFGWEGVLVF